MRHYRQVICVAASLLLPFSAYSVTIMDAYRDALKNNADYLQAQSQFAYDKQASRTAWAAFLPKLSLSGDFLTNHNDQDVTPFSVNASQTVFNWSAFKEVAKAKAHVRAAVYALSASQQVLMAKVATQYFTVVKAHEVHLLLKEQVASVKDQIGAVDERYKHGYATVTDMDRVKASYDLYYSEMVTAKIEEGKSKQQLTEVTGVYYDDAMSYNTTFPLLPPAPIKIDAWLAAAKQQNLLLMTATEKVAEAKSGVGSARGSYLPTVSGTGHYYPTEPVYSDEHLLYGLSMNYDVFQGGSNAASVAQAQALYGQAEAKRDGVYNSVVMNMHSAFLGVKSGVEQLQSEKRAVKSNQSALDHTVQGYQAGTQTLLDVLDQQTNLYNAKVQYVEGRFEYLSSLVQLELTAGSLKPDTLIKFNQWVD